MAPTKASPAQSWVSVAGDVLRQALHPPLRDPAFWAVQVAVVSLAGLHFYLDAAGILESNVLPTGSPVGLLLLPVLYSALRYGLAGSAATALWATLLWIPDLFLPHGLGHPADDLIDLAIVVGVAIFVGVHIERGNLQRRRAEATEAERREAERRYQDLYVTNLFPIVIVDEDGLITEANPAATLAFGESIVGSSTDSALGVASARLRQQTEPSIESIDAGGRLRTYRLRVAPVQPDGHAGGESRQLVFQDLTEEYRERAVVRSYAARLLAAHEEERRHIAHEIHDDPLQRLIHLARRMDSLGAEAEAGSTSTALHETRAELLEIIERLRDVARGLRPPGLDQLGLVAAVRGLIAEVEDGNPVRLDFEVIGTEARLAPDTELGAFRVIQEAVSNVTRHACARAARVVLNYDGDSLRIRVADDGIGFNSPPASLAEGGHLGLAGMRERARLLGGRLVVSSTPGRGTAVEAQLPVSPPPISLAG